MSCNLLMCLEVKRRGNAALSVWTTPVGWVERDTFLEERACLILDLPIIYYSPSPMYTSKKICFLMFYNDNELEAPDSLPTH